MKILGWIIATPFIALALFVAARYMFCGPDREVIRVAKPVVKIIADDIVKNGIPESLADIEGLPYRLEGCKKTNTKESCIFILDKETYYVEMTFNDIVAYSRIEIWRDKTHIGTSIHKQSNGNTSYSRIWDDAFYFSGLCGPLKQ